MFFGKKKKVKKVRTSPPMHGPWVIFYKYLPGRLCEPANDDHVPQKAVDLCELNGGPDKPLKQ